MLNNDREIEDFVRKTLGCGCPAEVFSSIVLYKNVVLDNGIMLHKKIVIGKTLLVYILQIRGISDLYRKIPSMTLSGKDERDTNGYNRYRLVLLSDSVKEIRKVAESIFQSLSCIDDKIHLHVISPEE